jgi:ABC-type spermidine/putrescine transport system permease subunit II
MVLHLHPPGLELPLVVVLAVAGLGAAVLLGLALAAFLQRQSRPYLLVALALAALLARTVVASLSIGGWLSGTEHHLVEHALDVVMAAFVIGAVYYARSVDRRLERGEGG